MINRTILVGRLTRDPELRYTNGGAAVATFTIAVNRQFTNQNGEREADSSAVSFGVKLLKTLLTLLIKVHLLVSMVGFKPETTKINKGYEFTLQKLSLKTSHY